MRRSRALEVFSGLPRPCPLIGSRARVTPSVKPRSGLINQQNVLEPQLDEGTVPGLHQIGAWADTSSRLQQSCPFNPVLPLVPGLISSPNLSSLLAPARAASW